MERDVMSTVKTATTKRSPTLVSDEYLDLIRRLPLRPLRSDADLKHAGRVLDELVGRANLSPGERDYMEGLARFVRDYEAEHIRHRLKKLKPIELLKHLMQENRMNTSDLGYILGSRGLASEVLNGKRGLSKTLIAKLSRRFGVDAAVFLDSSAR